jgi:ribonuclease P protein component
MQNLGRKGSAFPRSHRLSGKLLFTAVYDAKVKITRFPLVGYSLANSLGHPRLGISISRHVGTAPKRNRIKRLIRESFRLHPYDLPVGYDLVIVVRPHVPMGLAEYQRIFAHLLSHSHSAWQRRGAVTH